MELTLDDLRAGLAARVKEARAAIVQGREEIALLTEQVKHASAAYDLSYRRFSDDPKQFFGEILQSMISLPPLKVSPGSDRQSDPRM